MEIRWRISAIFGKSARYLLEEECISRQRCGVPWDLSNKKRALVAHHRFFFTLRGFNLHQFGTGSRIECRVRFKALRRPPEINQRSLVHAGDGAVWRA